MDNEEIFLSEIGLDLFTASSDPAAGADLEQNVPAGNRWRLLAMAFTLTASGAAANRQVQVLILNGQRTGTPIPYLIGVSQVVQTAGQALRYFVSPGYADSTAAVDSRVLVRLPFPPEMIGSGGADGWRISTDIVNLQAGDQISGVEFYVRGANGA